MQHNILISVLRTISFRLLFDAIHTDWLIRAKFGENQ